MTLPSAWATPTVYIPLGSANKVFAVDAATDRIIKTYDGLENPHGLVATPDGEYLIAGSMLETPLPKDAPADAVNSRLSVVHPAHGHVMSTIPLSGWTHHQEITADGRHVISTHPTRGGISVADLAANKVERIVATGPAPNYSVLSRDGKRVYVSNSGNATVSEIDTTTWTVLRQMDAGPAPEHMVLAPAPYHLGAVRGTGKRYVSSRQEPKIWVVDQNSLSLIGSIALPGGEGHQIAIVR